MVKFGYKLMTEEHGPKALVENAVRAEAAGFDFVSISDHFLPGSNRKATPPSPGACSARSPTRPRQSASPPG
jgi:alkanesulfonate monooxygenase SsuD/methylene tetrahydromethanopterin reductase-like flavin-dependent oxidoreductase (luciferase family)